MIKTALSYDVFLSYSRRDEAAAAHVRKLLNDEGLGVFSAIDPQAGTLVPERIREALAESEAVVILASEFSILSTNLAIEVGAAIAWQKPMYVVIKGISPAQLPGFLQGYHVFPIESLGKLIDEIVQGKIELSEEERDWLGEWYSEVGVPLDQLVTRPRLLDDLFQRFRETWDRKAPVERLLRELFRLRKQGKLQSVRKDRNNKAN